MEIAKYNETTNLSKKEKRVVEKQKSNPISKEETGNIQKYIVNIIEMITIDFGLNLPGSKDFVATRLYQVLTTNFAQITLLEVKEAFNLNVTGQLDAYFKKKPNGAPDKEHYNKLSIEYFSKVLNAYIEYKRTVNQKTLKALEPPKELSSKRKKKARKYVFTTMWNNFKNYRDHGNANFSFNVPGIYITLLEDLNIPVERPNPENKNPLMEAFTKGDFWKKQCKSIKDCFDYLIENDIDFYKLLREKYESEYRGTSENDS